MGIIITKSEDNKYFDRYHCKWGDDEGVFIGRYNYKDDTLKWTKLFPVLDYDISLSRKDKNNNRYYIPIKYRDIVGEINSIRIPRELLSNCFKLSAFLIKVGYPWANSYTMDDISKYIECIDVNLYENVTRKHLEPKVI